MKNLKKLFLKNQLNLQLLFEAKKKTDIESLEKGSFDPEFVTAMKRILSILINIAVQNYESAAKANKLNGKPSPDFDYENHKGGKTKLSDLKGKYVYIDLWATWCAPCRAEIPYLAKN